MRITTPNGTLEGDNVETILKEHGFDCLSDADLSGAYLSGTDLSYVDLRYADLRCADLSDADLRGTDMRYADLRGTDLSGADMRRAYLSGADMRRAYLSDADLRDADLRGADLRGTDLSGAKLSGLAVAQTSILPDDGDIIGWKKARDIDGYPVIVKLLIPSDAQRSNATGRKCRASEARVLDLQDKQGNSLPPDTTAHSSYDTNFYYKKGETVSVENFDPNRWNEFSPGIHFFITRIEAVEY